MFGCDNFLGGFQKYKEMEEKYNTARGTMAKVS
jgi:hypothetical protein